MLYQETLKLLSRNLTTDQREHLTKISKYILHKYKDWGDAFNKSKLLNKFIPNTKYDYIWMLDVDVYLDIDYVISQLPTDVKLVRPFELIYSLLKKKLNIFSIQI